MLDSTSSSQIKLIRKYLKMKICEDNITFRGHNLNREHIYELFKKTVCSGDSHSALVVGPRGCGKTTLINSVLAQLSKEVDLVNDAVVVRLNGLIHHEEKVALKSITTQMHLENAVGEKVHGTFAESLAFLLSCITSGVDRKCKSMIFVLEEFDSFCHSGKMQTLLYNLFDITQSGQAPMCVVGTTCRLDVMELLEKRVKSRFSHRLIHIYPNPDIDQTTQLLISPLDNIKDMFIKFLTIEMKKTNKIAKKSKRKSMKIDENMSNSGEEYSIPQEVLDRCKVDKDMVSEFDQMFVHDWNNHVATLVEEEKVLDALDKFCYYTVNEQIFRDVMFQIVSKVSSKKPFIEASDVIKAIDKAVVPGHRVALLQSLSILELSLVIAIKHGMDIFDGQPMNFEMVHHRYTKFANANSTTQSVPRPVILKAFEHLQSLELITPVRGADNMQSGTENAGRIQKEYQWYTLAVPVSEIDEAVKGFKALPTEICHWYTNSVF